MEGQGKETEVTALIPGGVLLKGDFNTGCQMEHGCEREGGAEVFGLSPWRDRAAIHGERTALGGRFELRFG